MLFPHELERDQDGWHDMHLHARVQGDTTSGGSV